MSALRVGMRVRILRSVGWPELNGTQGVIVSEADDHVVPGVKCHWIVAPDLWGSEFAPCPGARGGGRFGPTSDQLEPILYDGNQLVSWESMKDLWTPQGVEA